ncbi:amidohydrolase family protein [Xenorhabdus bovienii]|uniref:amidohydrolase family protein n=1 Tax=Xenorhabdus bovienii TaxID=40576 RepID=UPI0023B2334E|nr:amidohydrolase family protein [Xenorhabdus bovienii]MDE9541990.1 amidohydrolase family protein [Xenorhabdus bovienii]
MKDFDINVFDAHVHTEFEGTPDHFSGIISSLDSFKESINGINFVGALSDSAVPSQNHGDLSEYGIYHCAVIRDLNYKIDIIEKNILSGKIYAIKINVGFIHRYASDEFFQPLYIFAEKLKVPIMFHSGDPGWSHAKVKYADPISFDEIAVDYPGVNFVLVHAGNPWFQSAAVVAAKNANVFLEGSSLIDGDTKACSDERAKRLISKPLSWIIDYLGSSEKLIFGSGWPMVYLKSYLDLFRQGVPEEAWKDVFCDNSLKLYGFVIEKRSDGQLICVPKYKRKDSNNVHYSSK